MIKFIHKCCILLLSLYFKSLVKTNLSLEMQTVLPEDSRSTDEDD